MSTHNRRYYTKVMNGTISSTPGGVKKSGIKTVRKNGEKHYVSKKKSTQAKKNFAPCNKAVAAEKKEQGYGKHDFVLLKGSFLKAVQDRYYK